MLRKIMLLAVCALMAGMFSIYNPVAVFSAEEENVPQEEEVAPQEEEVSPDEQMPQDETISPEEQQPGQYEEQFPQEEEIPQPAPDFDQT